MTNPPSTWKTVTAHLHPAEKAAFVAECARRGLSKYAALREAIRAWMGRADGDTDGGSERP